MIAVVLLAIGLGALGGAWRVVLGGEKAWAFWTLRHRWLHWLWDFEQDPAEPVLRRSIIMAVCPLLALPAWSALPWWAATLLTAGATLQWVWPGRDFARAESLLAAHGLWAVVMGGLVLYLRWGAVSPLVLLLSPVVAVLGYEVATARGDDRIGQAAAGFSAYACLTVAVL